MSNYCSIGDQDGYHFYYDVNDITDECTLDKVDYWIWIRAPNYETFRVMPLSVWEKMIAEDCNGYIKKLVKK